MRYLRQGDSYPLATTTAGLLLLTVPILAGAFDLHPYRECLDTEVWAWRADTSTREAGWQCVSVDDLVTEEAR